jgi:hypothetical protein
MDLKENKNIRGGQGRTDDLARMEGTDHKQKGNLMCLKNEGDRHTASKAISCASN